LHDLARAVSPTELWLSTDRGRQPVYRPGETMRLTVQSNGDGFLYCVQRRADDTVMPVFPAGALDGARLRSHEALEIPGRRRGEPLAAGPRGDGLVACYLADRDIGPELPHALLGDKAIRLPENLASHIDAVFDGVGGTRVVKAVIPVGVELVAGGRFATRWRRPSRLLPFEASAIGASCGPDDSGRRPALAACWESMVRHRPRFRHVAVRPPSSPGHQALRRPARADRLRDPQRHQRHALHRIRRERPRGRGLQRRRGLERT
jgi:hypothetical protein